MILQGSGGVSGRPSKIGTSDVLYMCGLRRADFVLSLLISGLVGLKRFPDGKTGAFITNRR